jgi:S1-C subfamily serine protease
VEDFLAVLRPHKPGDTVTVTFLRGDASQSTDVTLADRPPSG